MKSSGIIYTSSWYKEDYSVDEDGGLIQEQLQLPLLPESEFLIGHPIATKVRRKGTLAQNITNFLKEKIESLPKRKRPKAVKDQKKKYDRLAKEGRRKADLVKRFKKTTLRAAEVSFTTLVKMIIKFLENDFYVRVALALIAGAIFVIVIFS